MDDDRDEAVRSIDEITAQHEGEWVLVKVTRFDPSQRPAVGKVIEHSPRREAISAALARDARPATAQGEEPVYIFFAERSLPSGSQFLAAAANLVARIQAGLAAERARRNR